MLLARDNPLCMEMSSSWRMSLEYEMKPKRPAIQTLVELRITPLNLAQVGQWNYHQQTYFQWSSYMCWWNKRKYIVSDKKRAAKDKRYKAVVSFAKQVALQFLQVPHMLAANDLRTGYTYSEPSASVLSREKSGEVKPKVFRVITISDSMEEGLLINSATIAKGGWLQISMMQQG